jgi:hypothetical protein
MEMKQWAAQKSKVLGSRNIIVTTEYLNSEYALPASALAETPSATGHLVLLRIEPTRNGLPSFWARWDHRKQCVDVDLKGAPSERRKFKEGRPGYRGHKTKMVTRVGGPRAYAIDIETPSTGRVFKGTLCLSIDWALSLDAGVYVIAGLDVSAQVVKRR